MHPNSEYYQPIKKLVHAIRKKFTQIPNAIVIDPKLSDGALRVFLYMSTKPDNWQFNNRDIQLNLGIKRAETIAKYWKELINSGWISRQPILNENGKPSGYFDYILNFEPVVPTPQNTELVTPTTNKPDTVSQQLLKNRSHNNKESFSNKELNNTPLPPTQEPNRIGAVWNQMAENLEFAFSDEEQIAISRWAKYQSSTQKSITVMQIETNLQKLYKLKIDGYDIGSMISDTISAGYKWLLKPTPIYLLANASSKSVAGNKQRSYRYNNPEYFIPENKSDKCELRNYLERCYMRELVDPRTKLVLTAEQKKLFKAHFDYAKSKRIGITEYIYQQEVLTGKCLLEQSINGISVSLIDVAV